jgi:predicted RNA-binding protein with RPS1 domain
VTIAQQDILPAISIYTAEKLTSQQMKEWSLVGAIHKKELAAVLQKIHKELNNSRSPAKTINKAIKNLQKFFARKDVRGTIDEVNNRNFYFNLCFPEQAGEDLYFSLIKGEISGRSGLIKAYESKPILISMHALQRLFERLKARNDQVLNEIYSCLNWADNWNHGGKKSGAQSWPIPSSNGFFVVTMRDEAISASTITWMRNDQLSKKWGVVYDNIKLLQDIHPELMFNVDFLKEFLGSFPWMMHEHRPGVDIEKLAWESKDFELESEKDSEIVSFEDLTPSLADLDAGTQTNQKKVNLLNKEKISASYISGLNYRDSPPPFRLHSQHNGIVVQQQQSGALIVSLQNSWYGEIPYFSNKRAMTLGLKTLSIGDKVEVEIWGIKYSKVEHAVAISLCQKELADANWLEIQSLYPLGAIVNAETYAQVGSHFLIKMNDGVVGFAPYNQVQWLINVKERQSENLFGKNIEFTVKDYNNVNRNLVLEIEGYKKHLQKIIANGMEVEGAVIRATDAYALVHLDSGFNAMLHSINCWGIPLPNIGDRIVAKVLNTDVDSAMIEIGFNAPSNLTKIFIAKQTTDETWALFEKNHIEGEIVNVQVREKVNHGILAVMEDGTIGLIHRKEIDWLKDTDGALDSLKIGDIIQVQIICIKTTNRRVFFSKKSIKLHPFDDPKIKLDINECYTGVISSVKDYGYFVHLPFGMDGLIHKTNNPNSIAFSKGDIVVVYIINIDRERKRIGLSLSPNAFSHICK